VIFSNHKPLIDDLNGKNEESYVMKFLSRFQHDPTVNEVEITILLSSSVNISIYFLSPFSFPKTKKNNTLLI